MELLPLIGLAGLYVISNQKNKSCDKQTGSSTKEQIKESYVNMGKPKQNAYLTNTNIIPQNYPVDNVSEIVNTTQEYINPNAATDKYFNQNFYENQVNNGKRVGDTIQQIYSLNGNYLDSQDFKHNNMVPFYGGKIKGYTYDTNIAETVLDNMAGSGSQIVKKIEQAPLFKPQENMQWAYGSPNNSDFYQSRVNPGMRNNNVKPFATEMVGPGLNQGYGTQGSGGFNSGMESRDSWLPKTVDELRVATNPKLEYSLDGHDGPANAYIKNTGIIGRVEKHTPDTFFINSQDRWLTTVGDEKGQTLRPIQEMGVIRRPECETEYMGPAGPADRVANYVPSGYEPSKRVESMTCDVPHSSAVGKAPVDEENRWLKSFTNYNNHRSSTRQADTMRSGFSRAVGAVIAPIMDVLKPSRKEEVVQNIRVYGEAGTTVPSSYVVNEYDKTPTTVKETTLYSTTFNINNQGDATYLNTYTSPDLTQRDTTSCSTLGNIGGAANGYGDMNYDAAYRQHNNDIKSQTINNRANQGGTQIFNQQMNVNCARQDCDRFNNRLFTPSSVIKAPPAKENYGNIRYPQSYDENYSCERINPDILSAFKNNPYTHSLTTSV